MLEQAFDLDMDMQLNLLDLLLDILLLARMLLLEDLELLNQRLNQLDQLTQGQGEHLDQPDQRLLLEHLLDLLMLVL